MSGAGGGGTGATRFVFLGTVEFSRRCLEEALAAGAEIAAVLTLARESAAFNADWADLGPVAERHGVPCHRIRTLDDPATMALLRELRPDYLLVFGWSQLICPEALAIPSRSCIGTHPALLPEGRGRHPITWALVEGRSESGLTLFHLDEGADSGDIVWQCAFPIALEDDAADVYARVCELGCAALRETLPLLASGTAPRLRQDHDRATVWRKRTDDDRVIHWEGPTMTAYNLIRGLAPPYIGATTVHAGGELVVLRARPPRPDCDAVPAASPGTVLARRGAELDVRTGDGVLTLVRLETHGRPLPAPGDRLGQAA